MLIDYNDIIVHVFRDKAREFYDLDGMWADAPEVKLDLE
jgi:ribosome-associated protein